MNYKCIKNMEIELFDWDGFRTGKFGYVPVDSEWYRDEENNFLGGEVHLECINGCVGEGDVK